VVCGRDVKEDLFGWISGDLNHEVNEFMLATDGNTLGELILEIRRPLSTPVRAKTLIMSLAF